MPTLPSQYSKKPIPFCSPSTRCCSWLCFGLEEIFCMRKERSQKPLQFLYSAFRRLSSPFTEPYLHKMLCFKAYWYCTLNGLTSLIKNILFTPKMLDFLESEKNKPEEGFTFCVVAGINLLKAQQMCAEFLSDVCFARLSANISLHPSLHL